MSGRRWREPSLQPICIFLARNLRLMPFVQRDTPLPKSTDRRLAVSAEKTRTETDTFGPIEVAADRYWGAQAQRSFGNFKIGWEKQPASIVRALSGVVGLDAESFVASAG